MDLVLWFIRLNIRGGLTLEHLCCKIMQKNPTRLLHLHPKGTAAISVDHSNANFKETGPIQLV